MNQENKKDGWYCPKCNREKYNNQKCMVCNYVFQPKNKNCQECQFENSEHSLECSQYIEPKNPMIKKTNIDKILEELDKLNYYGGRVKFIGDTDKLKQFVSDKLNQIRQETIKEAIDSIKEFNYNLEDLTTDDIVEKLNKLLLK